MKIEQLINKMLRVVVLTDWHCPYHEPKVIELELDFCKREQPEIIILHELHDFYAISKYDKDPSRITSLQDEIDIVDKYLERLRQYCPKSRIILLNSNHLDRLRKYLWREAQGLVGLRSLEIENLLELKKHKIEYRENFKFKNVFFKHGNVVRKFSSYTARGEFEKEGMSGCSGHTHRLGMYFHRLRGGEYVWVECGCGCKLDPEYIDGISNWQQGFVVFEFEQRGNFFIPKIVPIVNFKYSWGNKIYSLK